MKSPSRAWSMFGRRDVLRLASLAPVAAAVTAGCTSGPQHEPDALEALVTAAKSDAALAQAIARAHSNLAATATAIATARTEHARALQSEIDRVNPPDPDKTTPEPPPPQRQAPPSADESTASLVAALRGAQDRGAGLVPTLPNNRAGLVGSVSASCASLVEALA